MLDELLSDYIFIIVNLPIKRITHYASMQNDKVSGTAFFITAYMTPSNFALFSTTASNLFFSVSLFSFSRSLFTCKLTSKCLLTWVWGLSVVYVCHMSVCARLHVRVCPGVCVHAIVWRGVSGSHPRSWWSVWSPRHSVWIWGSSRRGPPHRNITQLNRVITHFYNIYN